MGLEVMIVETNQADINFSRSNSVQVIDSLTVAYVTLVRGTPLTRILLSGRNLKIA